MPREENKFAARHVENSGNNKGNEEMDGESEPGRRQATVDRRFTADQTRGHSLQDTDWTDAFRIRKNERGADVQDSSDQTRPGDRRESRRFFGRPGGSRCAHAATLG